jgi:hypothetical protein
MTETPYLVELGLPINTPARTPLRSLDWNSMSPTPRAMTTKTPGTIGFDAKMKAILDDRIQTPDFSKLAIDTYSPSIDTEPTPLVLKTCPMNKSDQLPSFVDENGDIKKKLFRGVRKSLGASLMMKWDEE